MTHTARGEDRRHGTVTHEDIKKSIDELRDDFEDYKKQWNPMLAVLKDIAVVGRVGRWLGRMIIWGGSVAAAATALVYSINHWGE